jgi:serine/threonine protein kinase
MRVFENGGHPNISGLRDMYEDAHHFYLILDLVSGGEMLEHLIDNGPYSEADAARLMYETASAMAFMHGVGVVHADMKPENILLSTKNRLDGTVKIIDFGCSVVQEDSKFGFTGLMKGLKGVKSASSTGTTAYWPPERFKRGVTANAPMDMWAVGVILYTLLTGRHPFDLSGNTPEEETEMLIKEYQGTPPLDPEVVGHLSHSAIDLICKLLQKDPKKRLTAYEMLQHPWVRGETASTEKMADSDKKLSEFKDLRSNIEAGVFAVLISQGNEDFRFSEARVKPKHADNSAGSTQVMQRAFAVFDLEGKGYITPDDLGRVASEKTGAKLNANETMEYLASGGMMQSSQPNPNDPNNATAGLSLSQFNKLVSGLNMRHFPRGHIIFHAGDLGEAMYFLNSGKVDIQTKKGQHVALLRSGDFFGEGSLIEEENTRFTTAKCVTPVDVIEIKRKDFDRYLGASKTAKRDLKKKWRARSLDYAKNLLRLQKNVKLKEYKRGDIVYREGDIGDAMYRVLDEKGGEFDVSHNDRIVHKYTEGDTFGESSLLFQRPRS